MVFSARHHSSAAPVLDFQQNFRMVKQMEHHVLTSAVARAVQRGTNSATLWREFVRRALQIESTLTLRDCRTLLTGMASRAALRKAERAEKSGELGDSRATMQREEQFRNPTTGTYNSGFRTSESTNGVYFGSAQEPTPRSWTLF